MSNKQQEQWDARVQQLAVDLPYPPTPDLAAAVRRQLTTSNSVSRLLPQPRRLAWALLATVVVLLAGVLAIPPVRAAVVEWIPLI